MFIFERAFGWNPVEVKMVLESSSLGAYFPVRTGVRSEIQHHFAKFCERTLPTHCWRGKSYPAYAY